MACIETTNKDSLSSLNSVRNDELIQGLHHNIFSET